MSRSRRRQQRSPAHGPTAGHPGATAGSQVWTSRRTGFLLALLLVFTAAVFAPAYDASFLHWDDNRYVTENRLLQEAGGISAIWNPFDRTLPAYYPLVFTSYWLEARLWGLDPLPFHVTNVLLHLVNVLLAFLLARRLGAGEGVAFGAAAVFALHPTQVESVMWVAERKNVLSGAFYFAAFLLYLRHRRSARRAPYLLCIGAYAAALLAKTQVLTLPIAILLAEWLLPLAGRREKRLSEAVARVAPMLALSFIAAAITMIREADIVLSWHDLPAPVDRPFIAAAAAWFYIGKFLLPLDLAPIYPKWAVDVTAPAWWLPLLCWPIALLAAHRSRRRFPALVLWGGAQFILSLGPALGLAPFVWQNFSLVGNHFLYLSCFGGGLAVASLAAGAMGKLRLGDLALTVVTVGLLLMLGWGTHREALHWQDDLSFWSHAVERNPTSWLTQLNLGRHHERAGNFPDALAHFRQARRFVPTGDDRYQGALQHYLRTLQRIDGSEAVRRAASEELESDPRAYVAYLYRGFALEQLGKPQDALVDFEAAARLTRPGSPAQRMAASARDRLRRRLGKPDRLPAVR